MNRLKDFLIVFLVIAGIIVVGLLAFGIAIWPVLLAMLLMLKKQWLLLFGFLAIGVLIQTIKYRNKDIFADDCDDVAGYGVEKHLNDTEFMEAMFAENGFPFNKALIANSFHLNFTVLWVPHRCLSNPYVFYSEDGKYKATVYHTYWKNYWLFQRHKFKIMYDHMRSV
jgi:hypothetical protein